MVSFSYLVLATLLLTLLLSGCGGGDGDGTPAIPEEPTTSSGYTSRGWTRFESGDYSGALSDFNDAINLDTTFGEAHAGQGWVRLVQATSAVSMQTSVSSFTTAIANSEGGAYVLAGRAAAYLGSGGTSLDSAIADAQAALAADSSFTFSHRTSFNAGDIHLIVAFSQGGKGDFQAALAAADLVLDSGIEQGNPGSWQVDGTTFESFTEAVIAYLNKLSEQFSG